VAQEFKDIHLPEALGTAGGALFVGLIRFLYLLQRGRKFKWFDLILEPCLAIFGGMLVWALGEVANTPDLMQMVLSQIGAWGGPRTIHLLEVKYMGGSRRSDREPKE
jgi:hypothetical protein